MTNANCLTPISHEYSWFGIPSAEGVYGNPWGSVHQSVRPGMVTLSVNNNCMIVINLTPEIARKIGIALLWQAKLADPLVQS